MERTIKVGRRRAERADPETVRKTIRRAALVRQPRMAERRHRSAETAKV
jgi:hypothetical protein